MHDPYITIVVTEPYGSLEELLKTAKVVPADNQVE